MAQHPTDHTVSDGPEEHLEMHDVVLAQVHNRIEAAVLAATAGQGIRRAAAGTAFEAFTPSDAEGLASLIEPSAQTFTGDINFESGRPWFDIRAFGAVGNGVTNDTAAIQAAVDAAAAVFGVVHADIGDFALVGRVNIPQGVDLWGAGDGSTHSGTTFLCTASGAGISFGTRTTGGRAGFSGNFRIDGGGVATQPLFIGLTVQRTFLNIEVENAAVGDCAWRLEGTQNSVFINCKSALNDAIGMVIDYGAAGNYFLRCEFDTNGFDLEIRQTSGINGNTHNNKFEHSIFERTTGAGHVRQYQADWTFFSSCNFQNDLGAAFEGIRCDNGIIGIDHSYLTGDGDGTGLLAKGGDIFITGVTTINAMDTGYTVDSGSLIYRGPHVREIAVSAFANGTLGAQGVVSTQLPNGQVDVGAAFGRGVSPSGGLGDKASLHSAGYGFGIQAGRIVFFTPGSAGISGRVAAAGPSDQSSGSDVWALLDNGNLAVGSAGSFGNGVTGIIFIKNAGTVPNANPTGGGVLFCEAGALKYRGSSGTVTTLAPA